ncbi:hypothetical protein L209DRAFT_372577 [Thermothelomyces heterothallicus CBS 203.75]
MWMYSVRDYMYCTVHTTVRILMSARFRCSLVPSFFLFFFLFPLSLPIRLIHLTLFPAILKPYRLCRECQCTRSASKGETRRCIRSRLRGDLSCKVPSYFHTPS